MLQLQRAIIRPNQNKVLVHSVSVHSMGSHGIYIINYIVGQYRLKVEIRIKYKNFQILFLFIIYSYFLFIYLFRLKVEIRIKYKNFQILFLFIIYSYFLFIYLFIYKCLSAVAYRGGVFGGFNPPPRNFEGPPKSCQTQPDCENCSKLLNLGRQQSKMFGKKAVKF